MVEFHPLLTLCVKQEAQSIESFVFQKSDFPNFGMVISLQDKQHLQLELTRYALAFYTLSMGALLDSEL
jgi:hypothetical protein